MAVFIKRAGAPTGPIHINFGNKTYIIDDDTNTSITETDSAFVPVLKANDFLQLQSDDVPYVTTPLTYPVTAVPKKTPATGDRITRGTQTSFITVGETNIDLQAFGLPTDGASDCHPAVLAAINPANGSGGRLNFPPGTFKFTTSAHNDLTGGDWNIGGNGVFATTLWAPVDADDGFITMRPSTEISDLSVVGIRASNASNYTSAPLRRGIILRDRSKLRNVRVEAFGSNIVIDGNHQELRGVQSTNGRRGVSWAQNLTGYSSILAPSFTHGNQWIEACDFTGNGEASIFVDGNSKIDASDFKAVHLGFSPHGMLFASALGQLMALGGGTIMDGVSFEACGINYIEDQGFGTAGRRLSKDVRWINSRTGPQVQAYDPSGAGGTEMIKLGMCVEWVIEGYVADDSNTSFGSVGWGTSSTACGFRFENVQDFVFRNATQLWSNSGAQNKPMIRLEGAADGLNSVYATILNSNYILGFFKNASGAALNNEYVVCATSTGHPYAASGVKHYDGSAAPLGRATGGPLGNGLVVPIVLMGVQSSPPTLNSTIVAGNPIVADSTNHGNVTKQTAVGELVIGTALGPTSGGSVPVAFRFPFVPAI